MAQLELGEMRAHGGPREQMDLDLWVDRLNVRDCGEQIPWGVVDIEAGKAIVRSRYECISCT